LGVAGKFRLAVDDGVIDPKAWQKFGIASVTVNGRRVDVHEHVLCRWPFADLRLFSRERTGLETNTRPFLVVPPLAGGFPILLRDLVVALLTENPVVAVADWFDVRYIPKTFGRFGFDTSISYITDMIRLLGTDLHLLGVCQAVVPTLAATAYLAAREPEAAPQSLILMGGTVDPLRNPTGVVRNLRGHTLDWLRSNTIIPVPTGFPGRGRLVYPKTLQLATLTAYVTRHCLEGRELYWKLVADDGVDPVHFPFVTLAYTLMDLPAEHFLENIRCVFQDRDLVTGKFIFANTKIDPLAIRKTALMTVEGERDDIAAPGQTKAAHDLCGSIPKDKQRHLLVDGCGHFSLFHGHICRTQIVPEIMGFLSHEART